MNRPVVDPIARFNASEMIVMQRDVCVTAIYCFYLLRYNAYIYIVSGII